MNAPKAARRRADAEEAEDFSDTMTDFVNNGSGALLVPDNETGDVTRAPGLGEEPVAIEGEIEPKPGEQIVRLGVTRADISAKRAEYAAITFDTKDGYEQGRLAIAYCRNTRGAVDDRRKQLNADSLAWQRRVNAEAKEFIELIASIETPLKEKRDAIDKVREAEKNEALRKKNEEIAAKLRAEREAEDALRKAKHDAEAAQLAEQRAQLDRDKEAARLELEAAEARQREEQVQRDAAQAQRDAQAERARLDLEVEQKRVADAAAQLEADRAAAAAQLALDREAFEAEKRELQAQKDAAAKAEADRLAQIEADRLAAELAEAERLAAIDRAEAERVAAEARVEAERVAAEVEAARLEAMRPDIDRVHKFAAKLRAIKEPEVKSLEAAAVIVEAMTTLGLVALALEQFGAVAPAQATAAE